MRKPKNTLIRNRDYVKQRKAFGKTLAQLKTIQHTLAEVKTETAVCRAFIDNCNFLHSEKRLDSATASMAKYWSTDLNNTVAYRFEFIFNIFKFTILFNR